MCISPKTPDQVLEYLKSLLTLECNNFEIEKSCVTETASVVFITYDYNNATYCVVIVDKGIQGNHIYFSPNNTYGTALDIFVTLKFALTGFKY